MSVNVATHDSLNLLETPLVDNSIESFQYQDYAPQSQDNLDQSGGAIRIDINASDTYLQISESSLVIKGQLVRDNNNAYVADAEVALVNNAMMYLFSKIKYTISGKTMEEISDPGQITSMLAYLTLPDDYNSNAGLMSCWSKDTTNHANSSKYTQSPIVPNTGVAAGVLTPAENPEYNQGFAARKSLLMSADPRGSFTFVIPFSHMFGFSDYNKVIWNVKHSLTLSRPETDNQAIHRANAVHNGKIKISNITWRVPHISVSPILHSELLSVIESKQSIPLNFTARSSESTAVPQTRDFSWRLSVISGIEKPRWIIVGFQTNRNAEQEQNPAVFDHLSLTKAYVKLNSERYPLSDILTDFAKNDYSIQYERFDNYKKKKFGFNSLVGGTQVNYPAYKSLFPLFVFDVSNQNEKLTSGVIDMNLKFYFNNNVPANTMAYACIESDRMYKLQSDGKKLTMVSY